jgi:hypothetical protein
MDLHKNPNDQIQNLLFKFVGFSLKGIIQNTSENLKI